MTELDQGSALTGAVVLLVTGWVVALVLLPATLLTSAVGIILVRDQRSGWETTLFVLHVVTLTVACLLLLVLLAVVIA